MGFDSDRIDVQSTITLAKETLLSIARRPSRSWLVPGLTVLAVLAFVWMFLDLALFSGPVSALAYGSELRSHLSADYAADPLSSRIRQLRLSLVGETLGGDDMSQILQDPVPTATHEPEPTEDIAALAPTATAEATPSPSPTLAVTGAPSPIYTLTPVPLGSPAPSVLPWDSCAEIKMVAVWVDDDDVRTRVQNNSNKRVYLIASRLEWPDVPSPAYVDYFRFGSTYYDGNSYASPTLVTGTHVRLSAGDGETWRADFDDEPGGEIYGAFAVSLLFEVPGEGECLITGSTRVDIPEVSPTDEPAQTVKPSETPLPPTETSLPVESATPLPVSTP